MIEIKVTGAQEVAIELETMSSAVHRELRITVNQLIGVLLQRVTANLNGTVLHHRTGHLLAGLHHEVIDSPQGIEGTVGDNVRYARVHEFGFDGVVSVRAHLRKFTGTKTERMKKINVMGLRGSTTVEAHARHMHIPKRSFLRSALTGMKDNIRGALNAAVARGLREEHG